MFLGEGNITSAGAGAGTSSAGSGAGPASSCTISPASNGSCCPSAVTAAQTRHLWNHEQQWQVGCRLTQKESRSLFLRGTDHAAPLERRKGLNCPAHGRGRCLSARKRGTSMGAGAGANNSSEGSGAGPASSCIVHPHSGGSGSPGIMRGLNSYASCEASCTETWLTCRASAL